MELLRSSSSHKTNTQSIKFKLSCQEKITALSPTTQPWLTITKLLAYTSGNVAVLQGLLTSPTKNVVVKFGDVQEIQKEYQVCERLFHANLPGFIKFLCAFTCADNFKTILQQNFVTRPYICNGSGNGIGCIVMSYYPLKSLDTYSWKKHQIALFKNVLTHVCFTLCYAYETIGFVHTDLHAGNVVLRETKKKIIHYGQIELPLLGIYGMVMDLQRCQAHDPMKFRESIERILYTACVSEASDLQFFFNTQLIKTWWTHHKEILTKKAYDDLAQIIEDIPLSYVKSERPVVHF
jgi:hypothetical protein